MHLIGIPAGKFFMGLGIWNHDGVTGRINQRFIAQNEEIGLHKAILEFTLTRVFAVRP